MPTNPWKLTKEDRAMAQDALRDVARTIRERGQDPDPVWNAVDQLVLACEVGREFEVGIVFAMCKAILGEQGGQDRLYHLLSNLALEYAVEPPSPPDFSRN
jgi:hypothetical protein